MIKWIDYINCGVKLQQTLMRNVMILSNNPLYDAKQIIQEDASLRPITMQLVKQIAPSNTFNYIPGYGFSTQSIEDASEKFEITINDIVNCFTAPYKSRKKYLLYLGKDLLGYKMIYPFNDVTRLNRFKEDIISDLIGANIPKEFIEALQDDDLSTIVQRVTSYLDSLCDTQDPLAELKELIKDEYTQNYEIKITLLNILNEIVSHKDKKSKLEKAEQFSTIVANTVAVTSPLIPVIQELLQQLL